MCWFIRLLQCKFCLMNNTRWPQEWPPPVSLHFFGHSNLVFITRFLQNYIYGLLSSNFPKVDCGYCRMNDNQDGYTNGRRLSVCTWSFITQFHPNFIYGLISSIYCSCLHMRGPLSESDCSSF